MLTRTTDPKRAVVLAHVPPFDLGDVAVHPATRQLVRSGKAETLEPRVMQVLVALAQADGAVVTRAELTELCWNGRIVSENAINRVLSRLRQVATDFAGGAFQLQTITKVGYRLIPIEPAAPCETAGSGRLPSTDGEQGAEFTPPSRRAVLRGTLVAGIVAAAGAGYWALYPSDGAAASSAEHLYQQGVEARTSGSVNMVGQAEAYFDEAVRLQPNHARAWAALALARAGQISWEQGEDQETMAARARFAARRALQIDPASVEAQTALAFVPSEFGRWAAAQAEYRRLLGGPGRTPHAEWLLRARLAHSLGAVGRCKHALSEFRRAARIYPDHPYASVGLTQAMWNAGDAGGAKAESDRALLRFPRHPDIWFTRMALLTFGSRPEEAVAFGTDRARLPFRESGEGLIFRRVMTARALADLRPSEVEHAIRLHRASVAADWEEIPAAARFFVALGRIDTAFELLQAYFFNAGAFADPNRPARSPLTRSAVVDLFWPPMAPLWSSPRFAELSRRIGLEDYWRETASRPDFRRELTSSSIAGPMLTIR